MTLSTEQKEATSTNTQELQQSHTGQNASENPNAYYSNEIEGTPYSITKTPEWTAITSGKQVVAIIGEEQIGEYTERAKKIDWELIIPIIGLMIKNQKELTLENY